MMGYEDQLVQKERCLLQSLISISQGDSLSLQGSGIYTQEVISVLETMRIKAS